MQSNQNMTDIDNKKDDNIGKQLLCLLKKSPQCVLVNTVSECIQVLKQGKLPNFTPEIILNNTEIQAICELIEMSELNNNIMDEYPNTLLMSELNNKIAQFVLYNILDEYPNTVRLCYVIKHCNDEDSLKKLLQYYVDINSHSDNLLHTIEGLIEIGYNNLMYHGYTGHMYHGYNPIFECHNKNFLNQNLVDHCERGVMLGNIYCMLNILYNVMNGKNLVHKYTKEQAFHIFMEGLHRLNNLKYNFEEIQPKMTDGTIIQTHIINYILSESNEHEKYDICDKIYNFIFFEDTKNLKKLIEKKIDILKKNNIKKEKIIIQGLENKVYQLTLLLEELTLYNKIPSNISNIIQDIISKKTEKN
jgi:hypothetical protein